EREEHTHLNVAAAVAAGTARAGLGILSAARAFGLDFVPVAEERYDLLMSKDFYHSPAGQTLLEIITDRSFQEQVEALGGYSMREAGRLIDL
ncbi:MAG TPA: substrate-binding domain-containing protein, partial [Bacillota bacterium]|nr:substrate-binding domain-containing protein [Bacillota bacterium]